MGRQSIHVEPVVVEISKLNIKKDDYLAIRLPKNTHKDTALLIASEFKSRFPDLKCIIFLDDVKLEVIHQEKES